MHDCTYSNKLTIFEEVGKNCSLSKLFYNISKPLNQFTRGFLKIDTNGLGKPNMS